MTDTYACQKTTTDCTDPVPVPDTVSDQPDTMSSFSSTAPTTFTSDIYSGMTTADFNNTFFGASAPIPGASAEENREANEWRVANGFPTTFSLAPAPPSWWNHTYITDLVRGYNTRYFNNLDDWFTSASSDERMQFMELDDAVMMGTFTDDFYQAIDRFPALFTPRATFRDRFLHQHSPLTVDGNDHYDETVEIDAQSCPDSIS